MNKKRKQKEPIQIEKNPKSLKLEDAAITPEVNFNEPGTSDLFIEKVCVAEYVIQTNWISDQWLLNTEFNLLSAADQLSTGHIQIVQEILALIIAFFQ